MDDLSERQATTLRGASPEEMETSVTKPLEEILNTVPGIDEMSSVTREGVSSITVQFLFERNRDIAAQERLGESHVGVIVYRAVKKLQAALEEGSR